jgi:branched-chain amino acid transport system ATP-binding protein
MVLFGVDVSIPKGGAAAVMGHNGAGKTTLLRVAAGLHEPTSGDVILAGRRVNGAPPVQLARIGVCLVPEGRGVFPNLTVDEHLVMATYSGHSLADVQERTFARFPKLAERRSQLAGTMSGGEQQMLTLARALATDPAVLLLDELSMGLAPIVVHQLYEHVAEVAASGVAVLVVEQFATAVLGIADHVTVLVNGTVALASPVEPGLLERISELYLGAPTS